MLVPFGFLMLLQIIVHQSHASPITTTGELARVKPGPSKPPEKAITPGCTTPPGGQPTCHIGVNPVPPEPVVIATTKDGSTWSQTFLPTSLTQYSSLTAPITLTTTGAGGAVALVAVFAGGLAWVGIPEALPPIPPPYTPPPMSQPIPPSTVPTSTIPTSTSKNTQPPETPIYHYFPSNWKQILAQQTALIHVPDFEKTCSGGSGPTVDRDSAVKKIKAFCDARKGKKVMDANGISEDIQMGRGTELSLSVALNEVCQGRHTEVLNNPDCVWNLRACLDSCDTGGSQKHGSTIKEKCLVWRATAGEFEGYLQCRGTLVNENTGVDGDAAMKNIEDFCKRNAESPVSPNQGNSGSYWQPIGNARVDISVTYNSSCTRVGGPSYKIDEATCLRFLKKTIQDCNHDTPKAKYGGTVSDECGVYSLTTQNVERYKCGGNIYTPATSMPRDLALAAINDFCSQDLTLDPNYKSDGQFHQFQQPGEAYSNYARGDTVVRMRAGFPDDQFGCPPKAKFQTKGDECVRKLKTVIDSCDTGTTSEKNGGYLIDKTSDHGCAGWEIYAQKATN